jgi:uncharacterized protein (TIGR01319 family)
METEQTMSGFSADVLAAEIGSTTTVISAFGGITGAPGSGEGRPRLLGQACAPTSADRGDVTIGLNTALSELRLQVSAPPADHAGAAGGGRRFWNRFLAVSSAAGGLRMCVHGLVYDMTVKAAREAALGAGAVLRLVTAGIIRERDLRKIEGIAPNLIFLAGGIDYGEEDTVLANARILAGHFSSSGRPVPVIYAGNCAAAEEVAEILGQSGAPVYVVENVYPRIDTLRVEPARKIIQDAFERHIVSAPGMEHIRELVDGHIAPTPGAVMLAAVLAADKIGDLAVFDIGGATTDIHSVSDGSEEVGKILLGPEPRAKRTVEGDLGVFLNRKEVLSKMEVSGMEDSALAEAVEKLPAIPATADERALVEMLAESCAARALARHAGVMTEQYGPAGKVKAAVGKDLTALKTVIGTGGPLTRLPGGEALLRRAFSSAPEKLLLPKQFEVLIDTKYIMAACGILSIDYPDAAWSLLEESLWPDRQ